MGNVTIPTFEDADPYTQIEAALWKRFENHKGLSSIFKPNNRIRWDRSIETPDRVDAITESDLPSFTIEPQFSTPQITPNVNSSFHEAFRFVAGIKTDTKRPKKSLFPIWFQFNKWLCSIPETIDGLEFVNNIDIESATFARPGLDGSIVKSYGIATWSMEATIRVMIDIDIPTMQEDN